MRASESRVPTGERWERWGAGAGGVGTLNHIPIICYFTHVNESSTGTTSPTSLLNQNAIKGTIEVQDKRILNEH